MNCPKCSTPAAAGATHCRRCGAALSAKAASAAGSGEIDLMPLEESKTPAFSPYEPPPGIQPPPPPGAKGAPAVPAGPPAPGTYVPKIRGANAAPPQSNLTKIIGAVVVVIIVGFIAWRILRTKNEVISGNPKFDQVVLIQPGKTRVENIEVTGIVHYTLEIEVTDGEMTVGVVQRSRKDPTDIAALKKLTDPLKTMKKGDKDSLTGEFKHKEQYSWVLFNETKKPARAKVKFQAQPQ